MRRKAFFGIIVLISLVTIQFIIKAFENIQTNLHQLVFTSFLTDPPGIIDFIYKESYYFVLLYFILLLINYAVYLFERKLNIFSSSLTSVAFLLIVNSILILSRNKNVVLAAYKAKIYITILLLLLIALFLHSTIKRKLSINFESLYKNNYKLIFFGLIFISTIQRSIALYVDPNLLIEGDDPGNFYTQAQSFLNTNSYAPNPVFSPGMSLYLYSIFKFCGEGHLVPKILLIVIGSIGLYSIATFAKLYFHSKEIPIAILIFYISSSHYVSFSNQFWNENLFNPILGIYFLLTWKICVSKNKKSIFLLTVFILPFLQLFLSLLRSWFFLLAAIHILILIFKIKRNYGSSFKRSFLFLSMIIFSFYLFLYSVNFSTKNGLPTSNSSINFLIGNNPYSQGTYTRHWVRFVSDFNINLNDPNYTREIIKLNLQNPMIPLKNIFKKITLWTIGAGGPRPISNYYQHPLSIPQYFYRITCFLFMAYGMIKFSKYSKLNLLSLLYLVIVMVHIVYFADYRFILTAMPIQSIFVSIGLLKLFQIFMKKTRRIS